VNWAPPVVATELRKILAYRSDFWVNFVGQILVQLLVARALWGAVFAARGVDSLQGLDLPTLTLYHLLAPMVMKCLFGENIGFLSTDIYQGGLNRYIVWPMPALGYKFVTYMTYAAFYALQTGLLYWVGRLILKETTPELAELLRLFVGLAYLLLAAALCFCFMALCEMASFWADNTWSLGVMLRFIVTFLGGGSLPLAFFPEAAQTVLGLLPFAAMVSVPVNFVLGRGSLTELLQGLAVLAIWSIPLALTVGYVWRRGNLRYTGVGM
jgi:ABC-2 type transport system permease protein